MRTAVSLRRPGRVSQVTCLVTPCVIAYADGRRDLYRDRAEDLLMDMLPVDPHGASWTTSAATTEVKAFLEGSGASVATAQLQILPLRPTETFTNELFLVIDKCGNRHLPVYWHASTGVYILAGVLVHRTPVQVYWYASTGVLARRRRCTGTPAQVYWQVYWYASTGVLARYINMLIITQ